LLIRPKEIAQADKVNGKEGRESTSRKQKTELGGSQNRGGNGRTEDSEREEESLRHKKPHFFVKRGKDHMPSVSAADIRKKPAWRATKIDRRTATRPTAARMEENHDSRIRRGKWV